MIAPSLEFVGEGRDLEQLNVGFLSVVEYPEWLSKVVYVTKKDRKMRVYVDFWDLNKASPKDDFPFPHIDILVDSMIGHSMLSFMNGFFGYSQILMDPKDMEKTSFITKWGTYCWFVPNWCLNWFMSSQWSLTVVPFDTCPASVPWLWSSEGSNQQNL